MQNRQVIIKITNNELHLDVTNFTGNVDAAATFVQDFCDKHEVKYVSYGWGYADLMIDGAAHNITPYGIDVKMMIEFCGGKVSDFVVKQSLADVIAATGGSPVLSNTKHKLVSVDEFVMAAADGNLKTVEKYMRQNPEGKKDGDYENPFYVAYQLAAQLNTRNKDILLELLKHQPSVRTERDAAKAERDKELMVKMGVRK